MGHPSHGDLSSHALKDLGVKEAQVCSEGLGSWLSGHVCVHVALGVCLACWSTCFCCVHSFLPSFAHHSWN